MAEFTLTSWMSKSFAQTSSKSLQSVVPTFLVKINYFLGLIVLKAVLDLENNVVFCRTDFEFELKSWMTQRFLGFVCGVRGDSAARC